MACYAREKVVLYGADSYPPYSYIENGDFKGIYVELLRDVAGKMKNHYLLELVPIPWRRGLTMLENGQALGLFPPYKRAERSFIAPYSIPLYRERVVIVCNDKAMNRQRHRFPDDFADVSIGINSGYALSSVLVEARKLHRVHIDEANGNEANVRKLAMNRIGCYINDSLSIRYTIKKMKKDKLHFPELINFIPHEVAELSSEEAYVGFSRFSKLPFKADFIKQLNAALQELKQNGEVNLIVAKYSY